MDKEIRDKIKSQLEERKEQLQQELSAFAVKDDTIENNYRSTYPEYGNDEDENANEVADFSDRLSLEHTLEKNLRDVSKALEAIEKGTYGICKYCGNDIEQERLLVRPTSTSCVSCKKKLTGEG